MNLRLPRIGIQFADERIAVFFRSRGKVRDEGFDQLSTCLSNSFCPTEVGGVGLYQVGIEVVLADEQAKSIAQPGLAIAVRGVRSTRGKGTGGRRSSSGQRAEFLDGAEPDTIRFAKSSIDGASFSNAHLGPTYKGRDVGRVGVTVADEPFTIFGFVNRCFE